MDPRAPFPNYVPRYWGRHSVRCDHPLGAPEPGAERSRGNGGHNLGNDQSEGVRQRGTGQVEGMGCSENQGTQIKVRVPLKEWEVGLEKLLEGRAGDR